MLRRRVVLFLSLTTLLLLSSFSLTICKAVENDNDDEDLSFLEEADDSSASDHHYPDLDHFDDGPVGEDDFEDFSGFDESDADVEGFKEPEVDDKDVVVLESNFSDIVKKNQFVMVEFYAPWFGHCQALAPEYATAAIGLKGENVILAKVDSPRSISLSMGFTSLT